MQALAHRSRLLTVSILALCAAAAAAQDVGPAIPDYVHSVWTTRHGLPQNIVTELVQTRDGYLWVATGNGLARFDGVRFEIFDLTNTPELSSGWITELFEDADGELWIGTSLGLARRRDGSFVREDLGGAPGRTAEPSTPIPSTLVQSVDQGPQGTLWVATSRRVLRREADAWRSIELGDVGVINGLLVDSAGALWIGTHTELIQWRGRVLRRFQSIDGLTGDGFWPLHEDAAGKLWVRGWRGLVRIDGETGDVEPAPGALADAFVNTIFEGSDGRSWIGAHGTLFAVDRAGRISAYSITEAGDEEVEVIAQDREGHLWFGVSGGHAGLHRLSPRRVEVLAREDGLPCDNASAITQGADGTVWVGLLCRSGAGLVAVRDGQVEPSSAFADTAPLHVASLLALPEGDLWMGTFGAELFHLADGRFTRYTSDDGLAGHLPGAIHRDAQGTLWVGTQRGLNRYRDERWTTFTTRDGLIHDDVRYITEDSTKTLWIGTAGGISRYADGRFTNLTHADGLPRGPVRAIHLDAEGTAWIGTYGGGLARLADGEITRFGTQGGLLDNSVHRILEDDLGYLWLSGDRGIRRVRRSGLNDFADGKTSRLSVDIFDERDGLKNAEANGMGQPAGWEMRDGSLWFPTQGGIVRIDPRAVEQAAAPPSPPIIERVVVDGTAHNPHRAIRLPPGVRELEIHYTAPAFTRPQQIQFRYRLQGHDSGWVEADTRRIAHYANLAPGDYRFELLARGSAGLWTEEGATLGLTLEPRWHQRTSVRVGLLLVLGAVVFLALRLRVAHLHARAEKLEALVADRTAKLRQEREGLAAANQELGKANQELQVAKQWVEASHTHLLSVLDQLRVGVLVIGDGERVLFASRATGRLLEGDEEGELVGRSLKDVLPISAAALAEVQGHLAAPASGVRTTARLEPSSGRRYWTEIEVGVDPRDERHRILYLYDVTEAYDLKHQAGSEDDRVAARLIGTSPAMRQVHAHIHTVAGVDATVLIEGETGTGKELVARSIHDESPRRKRPFVAINCAGLTESLLASQLFGHKRGAFTGATSDHVGLFEAAQGGTLLLDEIGDMPLAMQTHLLRVLQEREIIRVGDTKPRPIDVRVLASTHRNLEQEVEAGRFREDLLYRIRVARILLPPLRQRPEDIPQLAITFLGELATEHGKTLNGFGREAMDHLTRHAWPGNVRELRSVVEWAAIHTASPLIKRSDLPPELTGDGVPPPAPRAAIPDAERQLLIETLKRTGGNRTVAARLLGISRATLYRRLAALEKASAEEQREQGE